MMSFLSLLFLQTDIYSALSYFRRRHEEQKLEEFFPPLLSHDLQKGYIMFCGATKNETGPPFSPTSPKTTKKNSRSGTMYACIHVFTVSEPSAVPLAAHYTKPPFPYAGYQNARP